MSLVSKEQTELEKIWLGPNGLKMVSKEYNLVVNRSIAIKMVQYHDVTTAELTL